MLLVGICQDSSLLYILPADELEILCYIACMTCIPFELLSLRFDNIINV